MKKATLSVLIRHIRVPLMLFALSFVLLLAACTSEREAVLEGRLLHEGRPLADAQLEVYLKAEKDRATLPFTVAVTDAEGRYRVQLPPGHYFLIGKKKVQADGHARMLMAECPANPIEAKGGKTVVAAFSLQVMGDGGGLVPDPGTAVSGRLLHDGQPLAGGWVYVYSSETLGLMGPSYGASAQSDDAGRFRIELPAGTFYLAARYRSGGARLGQPEAGDLNGVYPANPVSMEQGEELDLGDFPLQTVDPEDRRQRLAQGTFTSTGTELNGVVQDQDGRPVAGVYVFAYLDSRMVGKPNFISPPTGADGRFVIPLSGGGTFYVGARSSFGGPLEPGEWVGTFEGRPDHGVAVEAGAQLGLGTLVVREVW